MMLYRAIGDCSDRPAVPRDAEAQYGRDQEDSDSALRRVLAMRSPERMHDADRDREMTASV